MWVVVCMNNMSAIQNRLLGMNWHDAAKFVFNISDDNWNENWEPSTRDKLTTEAHHNNIYHPFPSHYQRSLFRKHTFEF